MIRMLHLECNVLIGRNMTEEEGVKHDCELQALTGSRGNELWDT
jgi:hypothetical protein